MLVDLTNFHLFVGSKDAFALFFEKVIGGRFFVGCDWVERSPVDIVVHVPIVSIIIIIRLQLALWQAEGSRPP